MLRVRLERKLRKWSLQELGYHAKIQSGDLSRIERELLRPYPPQIQRLSEVLELTPAELLESIDENIAAQKLDAYRLPQ